MVRTRLTAVIALVLLVAAACGSAPAEPVAADAAPVLDGEFVALDGTTIGLAELQGHDVVLWFWAPW